MMKVITIRVGEEIVVQLDELVAADEQAGIKCSRSELTRRALRLGLATLRRKVRWKGNGKGT